MRFCTVAFFVSVVLLLSTPPAWAVYQTIEISKPYHVRHLEGVIVDPTGTVLSGVLVREYDSTYRRVMGETKSDAAGRFFLQSHGAGHVRFLEITADGFNPLRIKLKKAFWGRNHLKVELPIGG